MPQDKTLASIAHATGVASTKTQKSVGKKRLLLSSFSLVLSCWFIYSYYLLALLWSKELSHIYYLFIPGFPVTMLELLDKEINMQWTGVRYIEI